MQVFIGIDPGKSGAIAFLDNRQRILIYDFPDQTAVTTLRSIAEYRTTGRVNAVIEKVSARPGQGVVSMFRFGTNYGEWIGRLTALGIPYDLVVPQKWQKAVMDSGRQKDKKKASLERARRLFPQAQSLLTRKKDHNRADALLIAEYCRRQYEFLGKTS